MEPQLNCSDCKQNILQQYNFCPNCGKKLKNVVLPISISKQILIYLLSFFLPPLGLWPGIKYLRQQEDKSRRVGFIALILTLLSTAISIWFYFEFMKIVGQQLNSNFNIYNFN